MRLDIIVDHLDWDITKYSVNRYNCGNFFFYHIYVKELLIRYLFCDLIFVIENH